MPKSKQFLRGSMQKNKAAGQAMDTAEEYLEAGVDYEEAGEKWRGGDAIKSLRFFNRAIETYINGLRRFPSSFDLAYNKARVQYELTQHPKFSRQLAGDFLAHLVVALDSSRYALQLREDDADILFNTAQVLTSLAEAHIERRFEAGRQDVVKMLVEAVDLFRRCLMIQEHQHAEAYKQDVSNMTEDHDDDMNEMADEDGGVALPDQAPNEQRWATIIEPIDQNILMDTLLAQVETLTTLCGTTTTDEPQHLAWIEEYDITNVQWRLQSLMKNSDRHKEAAIAQTRFSCSLSEMKYRNNQIDRVAYEGTVINACKSLEVFQGLGAQSDPEILCAKAEILMTYTQALPPNDASVHVGKWEALTRALDDLAAASRISSVDNLTKIHLTRGDVEMLRYQLGQLPQPFSPAMKNAATLLKNASKYYRGAEGHANQEHFEKGVQEAATKLALVSSLAGDDSKMRVLVQQPSESTRVMIADAVDEGIITDIWLQGKVSSVWSATTHVVRDDEMENGRLDKR